MGYGMSLGKKHNQISKHLVSLNHICDLLVNITTLCLYGISCSLCACVVVSQVLQTVKSHVKSCRRLFMRTPFSLHQQKYSCFRIYTELSSVFVFDHFIATESHVAFGNKGRQFANGDRQL